MTLYRVTVSPRFPQEGESVAALALVDTRRRQDRDRWGATARAIADSVAADYCDSGSVFVVNVDDPADRALVSRRS